jgi:hypothetical protein
VKGIQVCSNKGPGPLQSGDNYKKCKNVMWSFKNLLLQNHCANFNHTWHKLFLGRGFKFVQMKGIAPLQGEIIAKK